MANPVLLVESIPEASEFTRQELEASQLALECFSGPLSRLLSDILLADANKDGESRIAAHLTEGLRLNVDYVDKHYIKPGFAPELNAAMVAITDCLNSSDS